MVAAAQFLLLVAAIAGRLFCCNQGMQRFLPWANSSNSSDVLQNSTNSESSESSDHEEPESFFEIFKNFDTLPMPIAMAVKAEVANNPTEKQKEILGPAHILPHITPLKFQISSHKRDKDPESESIVVDEVEDIGHDYIGNSIEYYLTDDHNEDNPGQTFESKKEITFENKEFVQDTRSKDEAGAIGEDYIGLSVESEITEDRKGDIYNDPGQDKNSEAEMNIHIHINNDPGQNTKSEHNMNLGNEEVVQDNDANEDKNNDTGVNLKSGHEMNLGHKEAVQDNDANEDKPGAIGEDYTELSIESELTEDRKEDTDNNKQTETEINLENEEFVQDYDAIENQVGAIGEDYMTRSVESESAEEHKESLYDSLGQNMKDQRTNFIKMNFKTVQDNDANDTKAEHINDDNIDEGVQNIFDDDTQNRRKSPGRPIKKQEDDDFIESDEGKEVNLSTFARKETKQQQVDESSKELILGKSVREENKEEATLIESDEEGIASKSARRATESGGKDILSKSAESTEQQEADPESEYGIY